MPNYGRTKAAVFCQNTLSINTKNRLNERFFCSRLKLIEIDHFLPLFAQAF